MRRASASKYASLVLGQLAPAFCVPPNLELHAYWDRVDDRLFKIRHCMDITGQVRQLALTEAALDPRLLTRASTSELVANELASTSAASLPPYRFLFLVDRAKSFIAALQSFGAGLLSAIEKRDVEEMSRLRAIHERNLAAFSTRLRELDVEIAEESVAATERQRDAAGARRDFYQSLLDEGNNRWEEQERVGRLAASGFRAVEQALGFHAAVTTLMPTVGSPFAMKYGGVELSGSEKRFAEATATLAAISDTAATAAQFEAGYARRNEDWGHQSEIARADVEILDRQIAAGQAQLASARRALEIHERSLEQVDEVLELMDGKFTNLGLYTWLAQQLQRLYRGAYDDASSLVRLAEQAFRFERGDDIVSGVEASYWDAGRAGLLAGERLQSGLQNLERRFIETNYRSHEIEQTLSVGQIAPTALLELRATGTCEFSLPEFFFDLSYPGHYRRCIKGVRLTIPCVTGPYVNVGATVELLASQVRRRPNVNDPLVEVPLRRTTSIATSTAQNDAGVFEFSFRDERYMPFEGAGAISSWRVTLPKTFRPFDYDTISDVVMSISYTAEIDTQLREVVENNNATIEGSLLHYVRDNPLARVFSFRQDFSGAFARILHGPVGAEVTFELSERHFPLFARGKVFEVTSATLVLRTKDAASPGALELTIDGAPLAAWSAQPDLGGLQGATLPTAFTSAVRPRAHVVKVSNPGALASSAGGTLDPEKLLDIAIVLAYKLR